MIYLISDMISLDGDSDFEEMYLTINDFFLFWVKSVNDIRRHHITFYSNVKSFAIQVVHKIVREMDQWRALRINLVEVLDTYDPDEGDLHEIFEVLLTRDIQEERSLTIGKYETYLKLC